MLDQEATVVLGQEATEAPGRVRSRGWLDFPWTGQRVGEEDLEHLLAK